MNVRAILDRDLRSLKEIHEKHYLEEFPFPDFNDNYLMDFVVTDDSGKIITGGGVRTILEVVLITDKDHEIKERRNALLRAMSVSLYTSDKNRFRQLHAFIQGDDWARHLKKAGFVESKGLPLVYNI